MQNNKNLATFRKPIRLSTGKYREPGLYFLTSCSYENAPLFGSVKEGKLTLNLVGEIIYRWWEKLPGKFSRIELRDFIVMPYHFHGIIIIEREEPRWELKREEPLLHSRQPKEIFDIMENAMNRIAIG